MELTKEEKRAIMHSIERDEEALLAVKVANGNKKLDLYEKIKEELEK